MSRVGIVVVSHSPALAAAAVELGLQMVPSDPPRVILAAGTAEGETGTDAMRVAEAISEAGIEGAGVLVFMDLGSAVLSAEMGVEFAMDVAGEVRLTSAPFVEGILAAIVAASVGQSLDEVEREAIGALAAKRGHLGEDTGGAEAGSGVTATGPAAASSEGSEAQVTVLNTDGLHARPAAQIVAALGAHDAELRITNITRGGSPTLITGTTSVLLLGGRQGDEVRLQTSGPAAEALLSAVQALFGAAFGESTDPAASAPRRDCEPVSGPDLSGAPDRSDAAVPAAYDSSKNAANPIGVSAGVAVGPVYRMPAPISEPSATPLLPEGERATAAGRIAEAAARVAAELRERASSATSDAAGILEAGAQMVTDRGLLQAAEARVRATGVPAAAAVWDEYGTQAEALRAQGGRLGERAADLYDARARLVAELTGVSAPGLPIGIAPYVLVALDLAPADTALLNREACLALVTEQGGPTSHTAIIARALGIPAVVAARGAWSHPQGETLLVDGSTGELVWDPDPEQAARASAVKLPSEFDGHGTTSDGHHVPLLANVGSGADAVGGADAHAEGVGLFRTEFCFLGREDAPSVEEQIAEYRQVFAAFPGKRVVIRTLDAGSDKPLAFVTPAAEENPALGVRGYRTAFARPEILDQQLEAIARAAALESAEVAVMAPMIATVDEAADFVAAARAHGLKHVGIMIETPSAVLVADRLFEVVDFVSLGTNDLTQYTMAADRLSGELAELNDPWQPAVLDLISMVGAAGAQAGKSVGVCGEAAADPLLAAVLVGAGVTSLSMSPRSLPAVAELLGDVSLEWCRAAAETAIHARSAREARSAVQGKRAGN